MPSLGVGHGRKIDHMRVLHRQIPGRLEPLSHRRPHRDRQQQLRENHPTDSSQSEERLNAVDPLAHLTATLTAIVNGHKQSQIDRAKARSRRVDSSLPITNEEFLDPRPSVDVGCIEFAGGVFS